MSLRPIIFVISPFNDRFRDMAILQYLCWKSLRLTLFFFFVDRLLKDVQFYVLSSFSKGESTWMANS